MDISVLDSSFNLVRVIDVYKSLLWTTRFADAGEFELTMNMTPGALSEVRCGSYLVLDDPTRPMVIEQIEINTDQEGGNLCVVSGKTLETLLTRRIVWEQTILTGGMQDGLLQLFNKNLISPANTDRAIPGFSFEVSNNELITSQLIDAQYEGEDLFTITKKLCEETSLGFRVTTPSSGNFVFGLYTGIDRSYSQTTNSYVVFSPEFENLDHTNYLETEADYKTVARVGGEGEGTAKKYTSVSRGPDVGIDRREMYVSATGTSTNPGDTTPVPKAEYTKHLRKKGVEALGEKRIFTGFDGEVDPAITYEYGVDYELGDIVQIENEYGLTGSSRIIEYIRSIEENLVKTYPTFETII